MVLCCFYSMTYFKRLISCTDLHAILDCQDLIILDASIPPVGNMSAPIHSWPSIAIPNAKRFDLNKDFSDPTSNLPHTMPTAEHFENAARALGINQQSQIIVYDDLGLFSAARAWYMFRAMGHENIAVLDGGLPRWLSLNKPVSKNENASDSVKVFNAEGDFVANKQAGYFCDWQYVEQQTLKQEALIIDARASGRFKGLEAEPRVGVRSGHMLNAKNLPFQDLLEDGLLKSSQVLVNIFNQINPDRKAMVMSCGSGVTACVLALAAAKADENTAFTTRVSVYDGSWSEWGSLPQLAVVSERDEQ